MGAQNEQRNPVQHSTIIFIAYNQAYAMKFLNMGAHVMHCGK